MKRGARIRVSSPEERSLDGITFASKAEMQRYAELKIMEKAGIIKDLELQPEFILQDAFIWRNKKFNKIVYRADFRYLDLTTNRIVVEDVKAKTFLTEVYKLKKKMLLKRYPDLNFVEVKR